jgi:hypothetical protein
VGLVDFGKCPGRSLTSDARADHPSARETGIRGQVIFGSVLCGIGAYLALRLLVRYLSDSKRTLTPFGIYCMAAGLACFIVLSVR